METIGGLVIDGVMVAILTTFVAVVVAVLHPLSYAAEIETALPIALALGGAATLYAHR